MLELHFSREYAGVDKPQIITKISHSNIFISTNKSVILGEPVASDPTLRTEEECQILCVQPIEGIVRELENRLNQSANVLLGQANNIIVNTAQILQPNATLILPSEQVTSWLHIFFNKKFICRSQICLPQPSNPGPRSLRRLSHRVLYNKLRA